MASRTALAISPLRSINDWLSIALTFTVTYGAALALLDPLPDFALGAAALTDAAPGVALRSVSLIWTLGGGV